MLDVHWKFLLTFWDGCLLLTINVSGLNPTQQSKPKRHRRSVVDDDDFDGDILQHLDAAFKREQATLRQQKCRLRKRLRRAEQNPTGNCFPGRVSDDDQMNCMKRLRVALGPIGLDECCLICDRLVARRDMIRKESSDWKFVDQLRDCLGEVNASIPIELREQYKLPPHVQGFDGVLVSPRGVHCYIDEDDCPSAWMMICKVCAVAIHDRKLPKFAIVNGFFIGKLPECISSLTIPERFMTQLCSVGAMTRVMPGGRHRCIRSHCVAFDCTPGPPVTVFRTGLLWSATSPKVSY
jgi:hypothetical protein